MYIYVCIPSFKGEPHVTEQEVFTEYSKALEFVEQNFYKPDCTGTSLHEHFINI